MNLSSPSSDVEKQGGVFPRGVGEFLHGIGLIEVRQGEGTRRRTNAQCLQRVGINPNLDVVTLPVTLVVMLARISRVSQYEHSAP